MKAKLGAAVIVVRLHSIDRQNLPDAGLLNILMRAECLD